MLVILLLNPYLAEELLQNVLDNMTDLHWGSRHARSKAWARDILPTPESRSLYKFQVKSIRPIPRGGGRRNVDELSFGPSSQRSFFNTGNHIYTSSLSGVPVTSSSLRGHMGPVSHSIRAHGIHKKQSQDPRFSQSF